MFFIESYTNEKAEYIVYFARVSWLEAGEAQILFLYSVEIDPVTGVVVSTGEIKSNGRSPVTPSRRPLRAAIFVPRKAGAL